LDSAKTLAEAEKEARRIVNAWALGAAAISWVPGSTFALAGINSKLVKDIADAFGVETYSLKEIVAAVAPAFLWTAPGEVLSFFPGLGWAVKAGIAVVVAKGTGEAIIKYFMAKSPYAQHGASSGRLTPHA
jgi:hypothetical protein